MSKYVLTVEEEAEYNLQSLKSGYWEAYCGSCDYFGTDDCPYKNKVTDITRWNIDIHCNKFNN